MSRITPSPRSASVRKKQLMIAGGVTAVLAGVALAAAWFADGGSSKTKLQEIQRPEQLNLNLPLPGQQLNDKDVWRANESSKIEALNREMSALKLSLQENERTKSNLQTPSTSAMNELPLPPPPPALPAATGRAFQPIQGSIAGQTAGAPAQPQPIVKRSFTLDVAEAAGGTVRPAEPASASVSVGKPNETREADVNTQTAENYLPAGTFFRVVLLAGLDAPTGGQAQNNPHPVLLRVLDPAQLPNRYLADMKDCVLTANGYGDISSERAYIRLDRMSCIDQQGGAVDVSVKGYIAGEDGKAGMRGRLVTKQGQALANAFLAGIGSGIGTAFKQNATTTSVSPLGSTSTIADGKELQAGLAEGVGSAMQQLSKYYIKLAEQIFPVIEVDGGRVADVILTRGISIERR
ncbi:conjugal transfer protein TraB [Betaproteobacteria bacterium SCN1]|nr:conjugal transfer protein TraB [Betaproteobacteria bacterium SCN1]